MTDTKDKSKIEMTEELEEMKNNLTPEQMKWCELYQGGMSAVDALREAGLASGNGVDVREKAQMMASSPRLIAYMAEMNRVIASRSIMTIEAIDQKWSDIASTNIADIVEIGKLYEMYNQDGLPSGAPVQVIQLKDKTELTAAQLTAIKKIKPCPGGVEIELHDKMKALEMLAKRHMAFTEKVEHNHTGNVQVVSFVGRNGRGPREFKNDN